MMQASNGRDATFVVKIPKRERNIVVERSGSRRDATFVATNRLAKRERSVISEAKRSVILCNVARGHAMRPVRQHVSKSSHHAHRQFYMRFRWVK